MRRLHGTFLTLMLMCLSGCRDSASPAGGPSDFASHADSGGQATGESAATLAARAMDATLAQAQRREAAAQMMTASEPDAAIPAMWTLMATSDDESVREMMARRLGDLRDIDSSPKLLDALEDPVPRVQEAAAHSLLKMLGRDFFFRADDPPERKQAVVQRYRKYWEDIQNSPHTNQLLRENNQRLRREWEQASPPGP